MLTLFTDLLMLNPHLTLGCPWLKTSTNLIIDWISDESRRLGEWKKNSSSLSFFGSKTPISLNFGYISSMKTLFLLLQTKWSSGKRDDEGGSSYLIAKNPLDQRKCTKGWWQLTLLQLEKTRGFFEATFATIDNHLPAFLSKYTCQRNCDDRLDN